MRLKSGAGTPVPYLTPRFLLVAAMWRAVCLARAHGGGAVADQMEADLRSIATLWDVGLPQDADG